MCDWFCRTTHGFAAQEPITLHFERPGRNIPEFPAVKPARRSSCSHQNNTSVKIISGQAKPTWLLCQKPKEISQRGLPPHFSIIIRHFHAEKPNHSIKKKSKNALIILLRMNTWHSKRIFWNESRLETKVHRLVFFDNEMENEFLGSLESSRLHIHNDSTQANVSPYLSLNINDGFSNGKNVTTYLH